MPRKKKPPEVAAVDKLIRAIEKRLRSLRRRAPRELRESIDLKIRMLEKVNEQIQLYFTQGSCTYVKR